MPHGQHRHRREPTQVPAQPRAVSVSFHRSRNRFWSLVPVSTAIATFSPVVSGDQVTSRSVLFLKNGTALPPVAAPPTATTASIPCVPGDAISFTVVDTNIVGPSLPSNSVSGTDPFPVPTAVPTTPTADSVAFTDP